MSGKTFLAQDFVGMDTTHQEFLLLMSLSLYSLRAVLLAFCTFTSLPGFTSFKSSGSDAAILTKAAPCFT